MFGRIRTGFPLGNLTGAIDSWISKRLWLQVVLGLALGIAVGALLGPDTGLVTPEDAETIGAWLALPGKIFLGLISIVLVPLVFGSILQGLTGTSDTARLKSVGLKMVVFVLATTTAAAALGVVLAEHIEPGRYIALDQADTEPSVAGRFAPEPRERPVVRQAPDIIAGLLPTNPQEAVLNQDMLAIVILAVLLGLACQQANPAKARSFLQFVDGLLEIAMVVVKWAMYLTPYAVFGLTAQLIARQGLATVASLGVYMATVVAGLIILLAVYYALVALSGRNPLRFAKAAAEAQLLGFSTSSSAAVMPLSIETLVKKLGIDKNMAGIIVPLGATINMAGTALYQAVAVIFLAQFTGQELSLTEQAMIVGTLVVSSIGAPGTPGISIVILANVVTGFGISAAGLPLILGVDRLLDMCRTVVNVSGDLTAGVLIGGRAVDRPANEEEQAAPAGTA